MIVFFSDISIYFHTITTNSDFSDNVALNDFKQLSMEFSLLFFTSESLSSSFSFSLSTSAYNSIRRQLASKEISGRSFVSSSVIQFLRSDRILMMLRALMSPDVYMFRAML